MSKKTIVTAQIQFRGFRKPPQKRSLDSGDKSSALPLKDGWLYLFKALPDMQSWYFSHEIYANKNGKYQLVDLKKNFSKNTRPPSKKVLDAVVLDTMETQPSPIVGDNTPVEYPIHYLVLFSRIQLPWSRLPTMGKELRVPLDTKAKSRWWMFNEWVSKRGVRRTYFSPKYVSKNGTFYISYLWDPILKAKYYHGEFIKKRDAYLQWVNHPVRYKKRYLYQTIQEISKKRNVYKFLNQSEFSKAGAYDGKELWYVSGYDKWAAKQAKLMDGKEFQAIWQDFSAAGDPVRDKAEAIMAELFERLHEAKPTRKYLYKVYQDPKSFLNAAIFEATRKANSATFQLLEVLSGVIIRVKGEKAFLEIKTIIRRRTGLVLASAKWAPGSKVKYSLSPPTSVEIELFKKHSVEGLAKKIGDSKIAKHLVAVIELVNLGLQFRSLLSSTSSVDTVKNLFAFAGSVTDFLADVWVIARRLQWRTVAILGIVSGLLDAVVGIWDMSMEMDSGDYDAAIGNGASAVGALVSAAGSYMILTGGAVSETGVGLVPGVIVMFVGIAFMAIGAVIVWLSDNEPIEDWVNHCLWGQEYGKGSSSSDWSEGAYRGWKGDLDKQIRALHNILYSFTLSHQFTSDGRRGSFCTLIMKPSMIHNHSIVRIDVKVKGPLGSGNFADYGPWKRPNITRKEGRITELRSVWSTPFEADELKVKAQIDVFGDGKLKYPVDGKVKTVILKGS